MRSVLSALYAVAMTVALAQASDTASYAGDERCPPPGDDSGYSAPYDAKDHPGEYPTFDGADKPGWSCSYMREDGVIVQYGDSRTPQQQWSALWGSGSDGTEH